MENVLLQGLIEITIYSTAIFLLVLLFRALCKRWLSPQMRYALWFLVILRLIVPVTWESGFHLITLPREEPSAAALASPVPVAPLQTVGTPQLDGGGNAPSDGMPVPAAPAQATAESITPRKPLTLAQWLLIVYVAGAVLVLAAHVYMAIRLNRRIRAHGRAPGGGTRRLYERVKETLGIRRNLPVLLLDDISSPALTAQLQPKLLLPDDLVGDGTREMQTFSLVHELMHYKRGDHLVCLLITVLRAVWWCNPVVWIMPRILRIDMESACDAQVVRRMDKRQKLHYANLLLELGQEE